MLPDLPLVKTLRGVGRITLAMLLLVISVFLTVISAQALSISAASPLGAAAVPAFFGFLAMIGLAYATVFTALHMIESMLPDTKTA